MSFYYYKDDNYNNDDIGDDEYYYTANSLLKFLDNLKKNYKTNLDFQLEEYNLYEAPIEVKKRNMEKFDRLTEKGYMLDFVTGEFKLSS